MTAERLAADLAEFFGMDQAAAEEALADALRVESPPLSRLAVSFRAPWWRRRVQLRLFPRRYRLWMRREVLRQVADMRGNQS